MDILKNIYQYRATIGQLLKVSLLAQYKKSFIGVVNLVFYPLVGMLIWYSVQKAGIINTGEIDIPYPFFILLSNSIWEMFSNIILNVGKTFSIYGRAINQIKIPIEVLYSERLLFSLSNDFISLCIVLVVMLLFGIKISWWALLFPFILLPLAALALLIGVLLSLFQVVTVDVSNYFSYFLRILFFMTPVIYSEKITSPLLEKIIQYNPLSYLLVSVRNTILYGEFYNLKIYTIIALVVFLFIAVLFGRVKKAYPYLIEKLYV